MLYTTRSKRPKASPTTPIKVKQVKRESILSSSLFFVIATIRRLSACTRAYTCTIGDFLPSRKHDVVRGQRHLLSHAAVPHRHCVFINAARKCMVWQRYAFIIFLINAISQTRRCTHAFMSAIWCKRATISDKWRGKDKYFYTPNISNFFILWYYLNWRKLDKYQNISYFLSSYLMELKILH